MSNQSALVTGTIADKSFWIVPSSRARGSSLSLNLFSGRKGQGSHFIESRDVPVGEDPQNVANQWKEELYA